MKQKKKTRIQKKYGMELILDLKDCELDDLTQEKIRDYLVELCNKIEMKRHGEPLFWEDWSNIPHLHGISAIQFIETSNVVCHCLPLLRAVYLNIFSCKDFDHDIAKDFSMRYWKSTSSKSSVIERT